MNTCNICKKEKPRNPSCNGEAMNTCNICKKEKPTELQPTRRQLIFGGFPARMEYRCRSCERKLSKQIEKMLYV